MFGLVTRKEFDRLRGVVSGVRECLGNSCSPPCRSDRIEVLEETVALLVKDSRISRLVINPDYKQYVNGHSSFTFLRKSETDWHNKVITYTNSEVVELLLAHLDLDLHTNEEECLPKEVILVGKEK